MSATKRSYADQQQPSGDVNGPTLFKRLKKLHKSEPAPRITARLTNGVTGKKASKVDETQAVVTTGDADHAISVSSQEESSEEDEEEEDGDLVMTNGVNGNHDGEAAELEDELSFGDMLKARHPDIITVSADAAPGAVALASTQQLSGHSLGTVLQQALTTNDKELLERCFDLRDIQAVKNTIQRLPSPMVAQLLARISERMYRSPGRAGPLMVWIQWSLVAHGGYLAGQPEILTRLHALNQVVKHRAQGLQPLLQLKGKLDMLHAQLELRRERQTARQDVVDDDDEAGVVYKEADIDTAWSDDDRPALLENKRSDSSDDEAEPFDPAQADDSDAEEDHESGEDDNMLDIEAEESEEEGSEDDSIDDQSEASFHTSEDDEDGSPMPERRPV